MTSIPLSLNIFALSSFCGGLSRKSSCYRLRYLHPVSCSSISRRKQRYFIENEFNLNTFGGELPCLGVGREKNGSLMGEKRRRRGLKKRVVLVKLNQFGFNGGGGGGRDDGNNARILGNLAVAVGLTYLSMTGQLGWVLDTIVSLWLLAIILPVAALGVFLWWAGQNIVQGSCPICDKDLQIFRSSLKDGLQLCPYCNQPFSVEDDTFVWNNPNFTSNQSTTSGQESNPFSSSFKKGKASALSVVDIEAEVKDVE